MMKLFKVLVRGPALTRSGYGEHVRFVMRALRDEDLDLYLIPTGWGMTGWVMDNDEEKKWLDGIIAKTQGALQEKVSFDVSIQVSIPNEWEKLAPINIGVTAGIETTKVAPQWLEKAALMDKIVVPSEHSKYVYENTTIEALMQSPDGKTQTIDNYKCRTPIEVVGYPVKKYENCDLDLDLATDFNFLNVAQWGPRKNLENCIRWFLDEFQQDNVGLILKTNIAKNSLLDRNMTEQKIRALLSNKQYENRKCKIYLLHGDFSDQEMHNLYRHPKIKALLTTSHGEGFGLPMFEAAYEGLPIIAPEWSGYLDFLCMPTKDKKGKEKIKSMFTTLEYTLQNIQKENVWPGVLTADSKWAYAEEASFKKKTRQVFKDYGRFKKQAKQLQAWVRENFSEEKQYSDMYKIIDEYVSLEWIKEYNEMIMDDSLNSAAMLAATTAAEAVNK